MAAALALVWCRLAAAGPAPVVVQLRQDSPEIEPAALLDAVARELDAPVVVEEDAGGSPPTITVQVDRAHGELVVTRQSSAGTIERRVSLPMDRGETLRTAVFLIGNLARDEASELLGELHTPAPPRPPPGPEPARSPFPESAPRVQKAPPTRRAFWIGMSAEGDITWLPSSNDTCAVPNGSYFCVDYAGRDFPRSDDGGAQRRSIALGQKDQILGGATLANARLLAVIDFALGDHTLLGARVGFATSTYPGGQANAFGHLHLEGRGTYVMGARPFETRGAFPMLTMGLGTAEHSASVPVSVAPNNTANGLVPPPSAVFYAWRVAGPAFASVGAGVRWAPSPEWAFGVVPLKATLAFGSGAPLVLLSPEITAQMGF